MRDSFAQPTQSTGPVSGKNKILLMLQKMDKNKDGVVTIDEFLETCQRVFIRLIFFPSLTPNPLPAEIHYVPPF